MQNLLFSLIIGYSVFANAQEKNIRMMAVGDIMMGTNYPTESYLPEGDGTYLWEKVREKLVSADVTFGNHEGVILTKGGTPKNCSNPDVCYVFRTPEKYAFNFKDAGFDLLSLANNHAYDFGLEGATRTQQVLDSLGIGHAGSIDKPFVIKEINGVVYGMAAYAPNKGVRNLHATDEIKETMQLLSDSCDIVIASFHGGAEGAKNRHITRKQEVFYGENRGNVYALAHMMIDYGADVVIGHGPHVVRGIEVYKNRLIAYSLGNFLTYKRFNMRGYAGEAPILEINLSEEGAFISGRIHSYRQEYDHLGPRIDPDNNAAKSIKELTEADFPERVIHIDETGNIERRALKNE